MALSTKKLLLQPPPVLGGDFLVIMGTGTGGYDATNAFPSIFDAKTGTSIQDLTSFNFGTTHIPKALFTLDGKVYWALCMSVANPIQFVMKKFDITNTAAGIQTVYNAVNILGGISTHIVSVQGLFYDKQENALIFSVLAEGGMTGGTSTSSGAFRAGTFKYLLTSNLFSTLKDGSGPWSYYG